MLTLNDGRAELWQWDTGRTLAVDADCSQVHFSNKVFGRSIDVDVVDGAAIIPDVLLQTDNDLNVWAFVGTAENGYTKISKTFKVNRRNKPADYVFTPTEQMTLQTIQSQIGDLSDLTTEAKNTLVAAINEAARTGGGAGSMELRVADGYVQYSRDGGMTWTNLISMADLEGADGITPTIGDNGNWYLGEEDTGKPSRGATGAPGKDGAGIDITGATVGQIAKITAVDTDGVPTSWSPVDMPSGGGSTVTWHDDLLAEGTIVANTAIYYDLGVTLAELREYRTFLYILKGASNVDLNNLFLRVGDIVEKGTIDRGGGGGRICAFEWVDTSKTILRQIHGYSGNPSMVELGKFATDNDSQVGYSLGQWNSVRYVDLSAHAETEHLFLLCLSTPKIEYAYQIRGLTK